MPARVWLWARVTQRLWLRWVILRTEKAAMAARRVDSVASASAFTTCTARTGAAALEDLACTAVALKATRAERDEQAVAIGSEWDGVMG
jgi:hypothetical protein